MTRISLRTFVSKVIGSTWCCRWSRRAIKTYETDYGFGIVVRATLLRPGAYDEDVIAQRKKTLVNPDFDMLYQQDCDAQARLPIDADHFPEFSPGDAGHLACVLSIDPGTTDGDDASFSVIHAWAFDSNNLYLLNQFRRQCQFNETCKIRKFNRGYSA